MVGDLGAAGARGALVTSGSQAIAMLVRVAGLILLARLVEPAAFGAVAIATSVALLVSNVVGMGLTMAASQHSGLSQPAKSSLLLLNLALGVVGSAFILIIARPASDLYGIPPLLPVLLAMAVVPLATGLQTQFRVEMIVRLRFSPLAISEVLAQVVALAAAIILALADMPYAALAAQPITYSLALLMMLVVQAKWRPGKPGLWTTEVRDVLRVGVNIFGMNAARNLSRTALIPMLGLFASPAALGSFDRAQQLSVVPVTLFVDQLQRVAIPILAKLRTQASRALRLLQESQLAITYVAGAMFACLFGVGGSLFVVLLGEEWAFAGQIFAALAVGAFFRALSQSTQWMFVGGGLSRQGLIFTSIGQPIIVVLTLVAAPVSIVFGAWVNSVAWFIYWIACVIVVARAMSWSAAALLAAPFRALALFVVPIGVASHIVTHQITGSPLLQLTFGTLGGILAGTLALLLPTTRRDVAQIRALVRVGLRRRDDGEEKAA